VDQRVGHKRAVDLGEGDTRAGIIQVNAVSVGSPILGEEGLKVLAAIEMAECRDEGLGCESRQSLDVSRGGRTQRQAHSAGFKSSSMMRYSGIRALC
jgi:hypothetical protein